MQRRLKRIRKHSPLPMTLRKQLAFSFLKNMLYERRGTHRRKLLDFDIRIHSNPLFKTSFGEIFMDHCYYFESSSSPPFIIDCGGNIGLATLYFKVLFPGAEVIVFEPNPHTFQILNENITTNELSNVTLYQYALGFDDKDISFFAGDDPLCASKFQERCYGKIEEIKVKQKRLSSFVTRVVDFLKIDVEGAEEEILDDLIQSSKLHLVDQMVIEYHHHIIDKDVDKVSQFLQKLESANFGYQINSAKSFLFSKNRGRTYQDIGIYAYKKA